MEYELVLSDEQFSSQTNEKYIQRLRKIGFHIKKVMKSWTFRKIRFEEISHYEVQQPFPIFKLKKVECLDCLVRMSAHNSIEITDEREIILDLRY